MGGFDGRTLVLPEPSLKYHPGVVEVLTLVRESGSGTVHGGQFDCGGRLLKCNGGVRRFPQPDWKPGVECKRTRELNCETDKSSRCESRS